MKNDGYLPGLGLSLGFIYLPEWRVGAGGDYAFGGIFGERAGYLIAIGVMKNSEGPDSLHMIVRHVAIPVASTQELQKAIHAIPGFRSFLTQKRAKAAENFVKISWPLPRLGAAPDAEKITTLLDLVLKEVSCHARHLDGKCEDCQAVTSPQIVLVDGIPGRHCAACQRSTLSRKEAEAAEYDTRKVDYPKGIRIGVYIALAMAVLWGLIGYVARNVSSETVTQIAGTGSLATGLAIFWSMFKALGKKERRGQMLASVITLASRLGASAISWAGFLIYGQPVSLTWLMMVVVGFALDIGVVAVLCILPWGKSRPTVKFQPVTAGGYNDSALPKEQVRGQLFGSILDRP